MIDRATSELRDELERVERDIEPASQKQIGAAVFRCLRMHLMAQRIELPDGVLDDYALALADVPASLLEAMVRRSVREHRYLPKPSELRDIIAMPMETMRMRRDALTIEMVRRRK